jgi:hypothetical protein
MDGNLRRNAVNRAAIAYVVTRLGVDRPPLIAKCIVEETPEGIRALIDDGSGPRWCPREGVGAAAETEDELELACDPSAGHFGETGVKLQPATVERWNALAELRPEMIPVANFDEMTERLRGF